MTSLQQLIAIALGGSTGALARFMVANLIYAWLGRGFPHGTLFVNVSGSFLMGLLTELLLQRFPLAIEYRAAILVGFLGAYTTFSTFALETLYLFEEGSLLKAGLNILLSTMLCLVAVWIGLVLGRQLFTSDLYPWWGYAFPYQVLGWGLLAALVLVSLTEILLQHLQWAPAHRAVLFMALLGLLAAVVTVWIVFRLPNAECDLQDVLGIFAINVLCGVATVWFGTWVGDFLWQLSQSR